MKAERRHELKGNSLAHGIEQLPEHWRLHGNKFLLGLIAVLLLIIAIRYRLSESAQRNVNSKADLTTAELLISQLRNTPFWNYSPDSIGAERNRQASDAEEAINDALKSSDDSNVKARAYIDRGDLNLLLAGFPDPPTTQPGTAPLATSQEYLSLRNLPMVKY